MEDSKMKKHVTVVAALHIGIGILGLIAAIIVYFALNFAKSFVQGEEVPTMVLGFIAASLPVLIGFMSTLGLVGGIGLLSLQQWARYLVIVVSALDCLMIPIGTLLGVYSLWVLFQNETIRLFEQKLEQNNPTGPAI